MILNICSTEGGGGGGSASEGVVPGAGWPAGARCVIVVIKIIIEIILGKTSIEKKRFLSGIARIMGKMPKFFGPLFRSAFLVNKKSLFLQKCQCIELLTVF